MPRAPLAALVSSLILVLPLAGCGGNDPNEPSPIPCSYTLSPANRTIGSEGGTGVVTVTTRADCEWTAASNAPWVSITGGSTGKGSGSVSYSVAPNPDESSRTGTMAIAGLSFSVVEEGRAPCSFDVTPSQQSFVAGGGNGTVTVATASSCSWTATTTTAWLTIVSGSTGQGNGTVSYTVAPHTATAARSGSLTVAGVQVTIAQAAAEPEPPPPPLDCQYSVAPVELTPCMSVPNELTFSVATQQGCTWSATADSPWINVTSGSSGNASGSVRFRVTDNWDPPRQGIVMVRWPTPTAGQNVRVLQAGCHYAVSKDVIDVGPAASSQSFDVLQQSEPYTCGGALQNACVWTAVSDVSWITITTSMPHQGDDRVFFTIAPNMTGTARTGTITVRDKVIRINQGALDSWAGLYSVSTFLSPNFSIRYRIWSR
jgi:hypothetical protein